jgi:hypothetical protein
VAVKRKKVYRILTQKSLSEKAENIFILLQDKEKESFYFLKSALNEWLHTHNIK